MLLHLRTWLLLSGLVIGLVSGALVPADQKITRRVERSKEDNSGAGSLGPRDSSHLIPRGCKDRETEEIIESWTIQGYKHQMSSYLCGGGSITHADSRTFQSTFGAQFGVFHPTKYLGKAVEKLVPAVQYQRSNGAIASTGYTPACKYTNACFIWFQPLIMKSKAKTYAVSVRDDGGLCSRGADTGVGEYSAPMVNLGCDAPGCEAAGGWGHCYLNTSIEGAQLCDGTDFPPEEKCPDSFSPDFRPPKSAVDVTAGANTD